jgi:hypothetical protein
MSRFDIKVWNIKLAAFIGYIHHEEGVLVESDNSAEEVPTGILSKVEISTKEYSSGRGKYKYLDRVKPKNPDKWDKERLDLWEGTIRWESENVGDFIYQHLWNPDKDWNQLMRVVNSLGMLRVPSDINNAYEDVCVAIEDYNNETIR